MADDVARAIGAGAGTITIAGHECELKPLTLRELTQLEREALDHYIDQEMRAFSRLVVYLPEEERQTSLRKKMDELVKLKPEDLPNVYDYDSNDVKMTDGLKDWLKKNDLFSEVPPNLKTTKQVDNYLAVLAVDAIKDGLLDMVEYQKLSGHKLNKSKTSYANWWLFNTPYGQMTMIKYAIKSDKVDKKAIEKELFDDNEKLMAIMNKVVDITYPEQGNG